jgi:hypothetical protein
MSSNTHAALEDAFVRRNMLFDFVLAYEDLFKQKDKVIRKLMSKLGKRERERFRWRDLDLDREIYQLDDHVFC